LGDGGRSLRCANCGNIFTPAASQARTAAEMPPLYRRAPPPPPPPPSPEPEPMPMPVMAPAPAPRPAPSPDAPKASDRPSKQLSDAELDALLGGQDNPDPIKPVLKEEEPENDDTVDPERLPDPDVVPDSLLKPEDDEEEVDDDEEGGGIGRLLALVAAVLLIAFIGVFVAMKDIIIEMIPESEGLYEMVGLAEPVGYGLEFLQIQMSRSLEGEVDIIKVEGQIRNPIREKKLVPNVRVALTNLEREEVMRVITSPQASELDFEGRTRFVALLKNPPPTARNVDVSFSKDEAQMSSSEASAATPPPLAPTIDPDAK
jgi:hypothetical protein